MPRRERPIRPCRVRQWPTVARGRAKGKGEITEREQREREKFERETWETNLREWESQGDRVEREKE